MHHKRNYQHDDKNRQETISAPRQIDYSRIYSISIVRMLSINCYHHKQQESIRQWRIQDFPEEGMPTPKGGGGANLLFGQFFFRKVHRNEDILGQKGAGAYLVLPLDPPLIRHHCFTYMFSVDCTFLRDAVRNTICNNLST